VSAAGALAALLAAADDPAAVAERLRSEGQEVVWTLGADIPRALVDAFGYCPIRLVPGAPDPEIDALIGSDNLGARGRALLAAIAALPEGDRLLISHADSEQPQIFATLRELARCGAMRVPQVAFLDLLATDSRAVRRYNRIRVEQVAKWLGGEADFAKAIDRDYALRAALGRVLMLRDGGRLDGATAHRIVAAAAILPPDEAIPLLQALAEGDAAPAPDVRPAVFLSGSLIEDVAIVAAIEAGGSRVVGEDHGWGGDRAMLPVPCEDPFDLLAAGAIAPLSGPFCDVAARAARAADRAAALGAGEIVFVMAEGDEAAPWQAEAVRSAAEARGLGFRAFRWPDLPTPEVAAPTKSAARAPRTERSRKSLAAIAEFGSYQRDWFARLRADVAGGSPLAAVNANTPQETLRALGVPFVVNQWWASIVAAKQQSGRYARLLEAHGLPGATEAYSSQGVAAAFETDGENAPWGGLPKPDVVGAVLSTDATSPLFQAWAGVTGARLQVFQRSIESRWDIPVDWWDGLAEHWEDIIEPERLDLLEAELHQSVAELEALTGRAFDSAEFLRVLDLVNEQQTYYRRTRDLVARTVPAPIGIVDSMPATMVPQWHRGTEWARDAARKFHEEVAARVAAGEAAVPGEKSRLMFIGRGVWSDMAFYQRWEESHGAIFVWSMYLALAADGYIRSHKGHDPLRALAARFVTMGDELRMPTWAGAWHVKEAKLHQCDGVVALSDADPLVLRAMREAGYAVLELGIDNFALDPETDAEIDRRMRGFLEGPVAEAAAQRG